MPSGTATSNTSIGAGMIFSFGFLMNGKPNMISRLIPPMSAIAGFISMK